MRIKFSIGVMLASVAMVGNVTLAKIFSRKQGDFQWGSDTVRGVSLGGWLVLEPFITPSIFETYSSSDWPVIDEWSLCEKVGQQHCQAVLEPHWQTFVSLNDFWKIKNAGFNVVRVPVGYWAYVEAWGPYVNGSAEYVDTAIEWARITGLKIVIDLHGAPKSQNGFDHSGHKMVSPAWGDTDSLAHTHAALKQMEEKYATSDMQDVVVAIEVLNEPLLVDLDSQMVQQFYHDAYYNLREISNLPIMLHDGFQEFVLTHEGLNFSLTVYSPVSSSWMNGFLTPQDNNAQDVIIDHHEYQIFGSGVGFSVQEHIDLACNAVNSYATSDKWTIVGEWSGAMTDCALHINGFEMGSRMEGSFPGSYFISSCAGKSGPVSSWSQDWKDDVRRYIEVQLDAFEAKTQGWMFWNFKTEGSAGEWDLFQLLANDVFPQPLWDRRFGRVCQNF